MQVEILKDHDHRLKPAVTIAYKKGKTVQVTRAVGEALIEANVARKITAAKPTEKEV